jgi:lysyl-tRNA synthetase, class II
LYTGAVFKLDRELFFMDEERNPLVEQQYARVKMLREQDVNPYPSADGSVYDRVSDLRKYDEHETETLEELAVPAKIAGRIKGGIRNFGSIIFLDVHDRTGRLQIAVSKKEVGKEVFKFIDKNLDAGDIVSVQGRLFKTRKGELTIRTVEMKLLTKNTRPLPEKWHGLTDVESRYRQRYVDLIMNPDVVKTFRARSEMIRLMREFFTKRDFLEVETPMLQPIAGGATAKPFETFHNALDMPLFMRVAPELYLKRLIVGGFERVFEINRNFRNEGISIQHNPEFTMLEFYQAYARFTDLMELTEELFCELAEAMCGGLDFTYQGHKVSFQRPWRRLRIFDSVVQYTELTEEDLKSEEKLREYCAAQAIPVEKSWGLGKLITIIFDKKVEDRLIQPTFIYDYPTEVSPLARRSDEDPDRVDRFELFITGREIANAFNELNDPEDQRDRFAMQMRAKAEGDEEAHDYDADYIRALEYGLPPTAGEGIGIDRLAMLLTDSASIRDVILFPSMRKETR